jgi:hypothetical protein
MKRNALAVLAILALVAALCWATSARAQATKLVMGTNFKLPVYYPSSNGVQKIKTVVSGEKWRFATNGIVHLIKPGITNYQPDGSIEWIATSPECTVEINTKVARGHTNIFFKTADDRFFQTGVGFLWQQSNSVLIVSNQVRTWIDKQALTKTALTNK